MTSQTLFYSIISILVVSFIVDKVLDALNASRFNKPIPNELADVYNENEYKKSQAYKKANYKFGLLSSIMTSVATLFFFFLDGFAIVDTIARKYSSNELVIGLLFFGFLFLASNILSTPFSYYKTFVIEEKFGFNKSSKKTFWLDKIKGLLMTVVLGGGLLALIILFYQQTGKSFWLWAWLLVAVFSIFMNMFYAKLIVPIFNKQTPLEKGDLRNKIETYANSVGFKLNNIFVIDGSKRSSKANAYFSGFGSEKRITLYDTLINDLEEEEIVAVLAHEVGHYKKNHIIINLVTSILLTGFTLWLLSLSVGSETLSAALGVKKATFHIGLVAFGILYSPISSITGYFMNLLSRKFEYQADYYAQSTYKGRPLINALKKLSKNSLSNLTPHPTYVAVHYSHPTLLQRFQHLVLLE